MRGLNERGKKVKDGSFVELREEHRLSKPRKTDMSKWKRMDIFSASLVWISEPSITHTKAMGQKSGRRREAVQKKLIVKTNIEMQLAVAGGGKFGLFWASFVFTVCQVTTHVRDKTEKDKQYNRTGTFFLFCSFQQVSQLEE